MDVGAAHKSLRILRNQYFQNVPIKEIQWPSTHVLKDWDVQNFLFQQLFSGDAFTRHEPSKNYQLRFVKQLIALIESAIGEDDVRKRIFRIYCQHDLLVTMK
jgi:hypothetical protein